MPSEKDNPSKPPQESAAQPERAAPEPASQADSTVTEAWKPTRDSFPEHSDVATVGSADIPPLEQWKAISLSGFAPGEMVAGRYKVIRFLGRGGMGEVHEVEDSELREHVALKTIRPEIAADAQALERFRREVYLARKVTHPNISRIFDIQTHKPASGGRVTFLTMELLSGENIAERLRRTGPMSTAEAFPLVRQMAAGLAAAHKVGVVHRDFKSANVVLVPSKAEALGVRAVVTDFGLARHLPTEEGVTSYHSATAEIVGTPAYMAPEQLQGGEITPTTDVYALGVVLYEMVTGRCPFVADTPLSTALKRLTEDPPSPRVHSPTLDKTWEGTILRCLARDPAQRFAHAEEVVRALETGHVPVAIKAGQRWKVPALFGLLFVLAVMVGFYISESRKPSPPAKEGASATSHLPSLPRKSVAVLGFKNLSGHAESAWLSTALTETLATDLSAGEKLRTVSGENIALMKISLRLPDADSYSKETLSRIRTNIGTDYVVVGSYLSLGKASKGQIRLDLRLQDAEVGETIASVSETGTEAKVPELVSRAGAQLRGKLGFSGQSAAEATEVNASLPSDPEAARQYSEGLARLRVFDAAEARVLLEKSAAIEPQHPLPHFALSTAWSNLGYDAKAKEEAKKAFDLSARLSHEYRLMIEGNYRQLTHETNKAVEIYRELFVLDPGNLEYGLRLAGALTFAGMGKESLTNVADLRKLPVPASDDPRIDLAEAAAANSLSDFALQQRSAASAGRKALEDGARLVFAQARKSEGAALWKVGRLKEARAAFEDSRQAYKSVGDRRGVADAINNLANLVADQGDLTTATAMYRVALTEYEEIGDKAGSAQASNNLALILWNQGQLNEAKKMCDKSSGIYSEIEDQRDEASVLDNSAIILSLLGDSTGARQYFEKALKIRHDIGDRLDEGTSHNNIGDMLQKQGDLNGAMSHFEQALALARQVSDRSGEGFALFNQGEVLKARGNLAGSRKKHEQALKIRVDLGEADTIPASHLALAELDVEESHVAEGSHLASQAGGEFAAQKAADDEAHALSTLARGQIAEGNIAEAQKTIEHAVNLSKKSQDRGVRLLVRIASARVSAASGKSLQAARELQSVAAEAARAHLLPLELEARLGLGEVEIRSGQSAQGKTLLASLQQEAAGKGFGLIARKAATALK